jgi:hypothetical protein
MNQRTASAVARSLWLFALVASVASLVLVYFSRAALVGGVIGFRGFDAVLAIAFATVGGIVAARRSSNAVGWLLVAFGVLNGPVSLLQQYAYFALLGRADPLPGAVVAAWSQEVLGVMLGAIFVLLLLLFPSGRMLSGRWHIVGGLAVAGSVLEALGAAFLPGPIASIRFLENPFGLTGIPGAVAAFLDSLGNLLFVGTVLAAVGSVVLRFRKAERVERQQLKWIAVASALVGAGIVGFAVTGQEGGASAFARPAQVFLILAIAGVPVAAGIAILRHHLYDIDRIVSRTLSYAIVTAILSGLFVLVALVPTAILGSEDAPDWQIAVATLLAAAAFRPVKRHVQGIIDRRFNRARYDAARTIEGFSARLREEIDLDTLRSELHGVVGRTMHPSHVFLWLPGASP